MKFLRLVQIVFFILFSVNGYTQQETPIIPDGNLAGLKTCEFIEQIEGRYNIRIFFLFEELPEKEIRFSKDSVTLKEVFEDNFNSLNLRVTIQGSNYFLTKSGNFRTTLSDHFFKGKEPVSPGESPIIPDEEKDSYIKTYKDFIQKTTIIGSNENANGRDSYILKGKVISQEETEPIPQATLEIIELNKYITTNISGGYSLRLPAGTYTLAVTSMGTYEKKYKIKVLSDGELTIKLKRKNFMLEEAVVTATRNHNVKSTVMGFERIDPMAMKKIPVVMGEQDIAKVALLLPGVQTISEVSTGFNVRGSPADQNMFYIDNLPVYNVSHLFGMYSSFNSDAIGDFSLYKSNIPIEFGGHLSSLFDVGVKDGNLKEFSARGGISPISSRLMAEGPIRKNKSSYLVSGRTSYSDWILNSIKNKDVNSSSASFYDVLVKLHFSPDSLNKINFLTYGSNDYSSLAFGMNNTYSNKGAAFRWTHHFNNKHWIEINGIYSNYAFTEEKTDIPYQSSKHSFEIHHNEFKLDFANKSWPGHTLSYGIDAIYYKLHNGDYLPLNDQSNIEPVDFADEQALKTSVFVGDEWKVSSKFRVKAGIRATLYSCLGPKTIYQYAPGLPRERESVTDTNSYPGNQFIRHYPRMDYRFAARYKISEDLSLKASYNKLHQYLFMLSNSISVSPTDKWKLSDPHLKPMSGQQVSAGVYKNIGTEFSASLETYYKDVTNLVEYKDGAEFLTNKLPETSVIQGDLKAYGVELMFKKKSGRINGWINYTYSNTSVKAVNHQRGEYNNQGYAYPANYDKPHALNLTINYDVTKRISLSGNIVYSTGRPITYPTSLYIQNGMEVTSFSRRNEYRIEDYFRMDLSLNFEGNLKKDKFAHSSWSISFYNLTARKNPYSVYFRNEAGTINGYRISVLGTIIPSIRYNLKLGNYED